MNWQTLFLSPEGRIGQKDYWTGVLVLFVVWLASNILHVLAPIIWLLLVFPWVCVFAKRLHDFGRSGWLILVPAAFGLIAVGVAIISVGMSVIGAVAGHLFSDDAGPEGWAVLFAGLGVTLVCLGAAGVVKLVFMLWVGLNRGDRGPNRYGPPPGAPSETSAAPA